MLKVERSERSLGLLALGLRGADALTDEHGIDA
jgi:hypothetical protein